MIQKLCLLKYLKYILFVFRTKGLLNATASGVNGLFSHSPLYVCTFQRFYSLVELCQTKILLTFCSQVSSLFQENFFLRSDFVMTTFSVSDNAC